MSTVKLEQLLQRKYNLIKTKRNTAYKQGKTVRDHELPDKC